MKCLKVQRTHGSYFLHFVNFTFLEKLKKKLKKQLSHQQIFFRHPDNNIDDFNANYLRSLLQKLSKELLKKFFYSLTLIVTF